MNTHVFKDTVFTDGLIYKGDTSTKQATYERNT